MRKLAVVLSLLAVFVVACTSGGDGADERQNEANEQPPATVAAPANVAEPTAEPSSEGGPLEGFLDPVSLLSGPLFSGAGPAGLEAVTGEADPALKAALLSLDDLPPGYDVMEPGEMSFSFEMDEGSMSIAMSTFSQGDALDAFPESMVISAVMSGSGELLDQSLGELRRYTDSGDLEREIEEALGLGGLFGIGFEDVRVLDASGLGDGGIGLHMVMTMDMEGLGVPMPPGAGFLSEGLAFDMYVFWRGDHLLMLMSMWSGEAAAPVDAGALAELMDDRAEDAF
jgi:hypothetical protein